MHSVVVNSQFVPFQVNVQVPLQGGGVVVVVEVVVSVVVVGGGGVVGGGVVVGGGQVVVVEVVAVVVVDVVGRQSVYRTSQHSRGNVNGSSQAQASVQPSSALTQNIQGGVVVVLVVVLVVPVVPVVPDVPVVPVVGG